MMFAQVRWGSHGPGGASLSVLFTSRRRFLRKQVRIPEVQHGGANDPVVFSELRRLERFKRLAVIAGQNVVESRAQ
jgi:hypothetical protein